MSAPFRLLYLGFAFPPGVAALHRGINPAGHAVETQMINALEAHMEIRSVGVMPFPITSLPENADPSTGIAHNLLLVDQAPELWHRSVSLRRLKQQYKKWRAEGWVPDAVMVYNFSPIYNAFIRWLGRQADRPRLVTLLLDSAQLGKKISASKAFRYRLKPFTVLDETMLGEFDACVGLSTDVVNHTSRHGLPFMWLPGACNPSRAPQALAADAEGPIRFGYFGSLGPHSGAWDMVNLFLTLPSDSEMHLCGYGKQAEEFAALSQKNPRFKFHGLLSPDECLRFGQTCDVLINPRPASHGNENNFASKLFDYALCRRAIITSRISGTDEVLGPEAFYFEPANFNAGLQGALEKANVTPRTELRRRGAAIGERVMTEYNWQRQSGRLAEFIRLVKKK